MDPESSTISETSLAQTATQVVPFDETSSSLLLGESESGTEAEMRETTQDARSTALGNEDLLDLIFSFHSVVPFPRNWGSQITRLNSPHSATAISAKEIGESRNILLKASLTCKTFFHPAIRTLWQSMDSIIPLVKLISGMIKQNSIWTKATAISEMDLQRFDFYAQLVRRLAVSAEALQSVTKDGCVAPHVLPFVHDYRPQGLLPSLKVLEITQFWRLRTEDVWLLKSMVPSAGTLSQLVIKAIPSPAIDDINVTNGVVLAASILNSVHRKSPRLTEIALDDYQDEAIFNILKDIGSLQSISLNFSASDLLGLTQSQSFRPSLDELEAPFSNLVNIHLIGALSVVYEVIRAVFPETPRLKNLKISLLVRPAPRARHSNKKINVFRSLVDVITAKENVPLESLMIGHNTFSSTFRLDSSLRYFSRLCCQKLKILSIPVSSLTGATFASLFPSPHRSLVSLEISSGLPEDRQRGFKRSVEILELIYDMVPNLKYLYMPILLNTDDDKPFEFINRLSAGTSTFPCHGLQEFRLKSFQNSGNNEVKFIYPEFHLPSQKFADLLVIARHIDHLFPHLKKVDTGELRGLVEERWLDGLEAAVEQFAKQRISLKRRCEVCGM